jgi:hypothetical protein
MIVWAPTQPRRPHSARSKPLKPWISNFLSVRQPVRMHQVALSIRLPPCLTINPSVGSPPPQKKGEWASIGQFQPAAKAANVKSHHLLIFRLPVAAVSVGVVQEIAEPRQEVRHFLVAVLAFIGRAEQPLLEYVHPAAQLERHRHLAASHQCPPKQINAPRCKRCHLHQLHACRTRLPFAASAWPQCIVSSLPLLTLGHRLSS